jgi:hypothetical protein
MRKRLNSQPSDGVLLRRFPDVKLHVDGEYTTARVQRMIKKLHRGDNASGAGEIGCGKYPVCASQIVNSLARW